MTASAPRTARDRARIEITAEITESARRQLLERGASELSLRAVARDLGMVSSAVYRYFPSRDALLTQLIIDAYGALGDACETADAAFDRDDLAGRWRAIANAARDWARANTHEYALIYGSPVPGYEAPEDTIDNAARVPLLLSELFSALDPATVVIPAASIKRTLRQQVRSLELATAASLDVHAFLVGVGEWSKLFGLIGFELFGTFRNSFDDADELFAYEVELAAIAMGLSPGQS